MNGSVPIIISPSKQPVRLELNIDLSKSMPHLFPPPDAIFIDELFYATIAKSGSGTIYKVKTISRQNLTISYIWFAYNIKLLYRVFVNNQCKAVIGSNPANSLGVDSYGYGRMTANPDMSGVDNIFNTNLFVRENSIVHITVYNADAVNDIAARCYIKGWLYLSNV